MEGTSPPTLGFCCCAKWKSGRRIHRYPTDEIVLDLDATDDPIHGNQEGRFYHGYYGNYCYPPLYIFSGEHLLCARLRRSNIDGAEGAVNELNLRNPLPCDFGAHGRFDGQAHKASFQLWATTHSAWLGAALIGLAAGAIGVAYRIRRWNSMQSLSALVRTVLPQRSKWPAQVAPFVSSKRETR